MKNRKLKLLMFTMSVLFIFSCKKEKQTSTCTDIDGNVYKTVTIGTQIWMAENLKTTKYKDGSDIPTGLSNIEWYNTTTGACAVYDNNAANNITYGKLYNWYAVNTGKLAPKGWHVPSDAELTTLANYLGGESVAGGHMKSTSSLWTTPNTGADNSSGFTGLPGGYHHRTGTYQDIANLGYWWSSSEYSPDAAWYFILGYPIISVNRDYIQKTSGFSVRCVRD